MENTKLTKQKIKKQTTTQRVLGIITDICIYPIVILAIIISGVMMVTRIENRAVPLFGCTFVRVLSGSMTAGGYNVGDVVILRDIDKKKLQLESPIRTLGVTNVPVRLHPKVTGSLKVWIKEA